MIRHKLLKNSCKSLSKISIVFMSINILHFCKEIGQKHIYFCLTLKKSTNFQAWTLKDRYQKLLFQSSSLNYLPFLKSKLVIYFSNVLSSNCCRPIFIYTVFQLEKFFSRSNPTTCRRVKFDEAQNKSAFCQFPTPRTIDWAIINFTHIISNCSSTETIPPHKQ